ncbi:hypothetical protein KC640_00815 [Candidatus Dojkabacteria bacterium]|uniref:Uncharacterized protein n=1 Tax=Candidatus Dojkabacteria bacterium TaxID=2099670 RepID=A0A955I4V9_9BACT|nr:hypothetical protein [Candidatus Dojkabacteria bacterium]
MQSPPDTTALSRDVGTYHIYPNDFGAHIQSVSPVQLEQANPLDPKPPTVVALNLSSGKNLRAEPTPTAPIVDVSSQGQFLVESYAIDNAGTLWFFGSMQGNDEKVWISSTVFTAGEMQRNAGLLANIPLYTEASNPLPAAPSTVDGGQLSGETLVGSGEGSEFDNSSQLLLPTADPNIFEIEPDYAAELQTTYNIIGFTHPQLPTHISINLNTGDESGQGAKFGSKFPVNTASCLIGRTRLGEPWGVDTVTNTAYFNCITFDEAGKLVYLRVHFAELTGRSNIRMLFAPGDMPLNSEAALQSFFDVRFPPGSNDLRYAFGALIHDADLDQARQHLRTSQMWMANLAAQGKYVFPSYSMAGS